MKTADQNSAQYTALYTAAQQQQTRAAALDAVKRLQTYSALLLEHAQIVENALIDDNADTDSGTAAVLKTLTNVLFIAYENSSAVIGTAARLSGLYADNAVDYADQTEQTDVKTMLRRAAKNRADAQRVYDDYL